jgi:hypothetical protein
MAAVAVLASALSACERGEVGGPCAGGAGHDSVYLLVCKDGSWVPIMTLAEYVVMRQGGPPPAPAAHDPGGSLDVVEVGAYVVRAAGWARDPDGGPIEVHVWADGRRSVGTTANLTRSDVGAAFGVDPAVGYDAWLSLPAGPHMVCVYAINHPRTPGAANAQLGCRSVVVGYDAPDDPLPADASWLQTVNYYRTTSGLQPVVDEPAWSDGIVKHLTYLRYTPPELMTGVYANAHTENPASPYYTPEGAEAGGSSNLGGGSSPRKAIEGWMAAPFHAIGILRPRLAQVGFGQLGGAAGLRVFGGTFGGQAPSGPVLFPGDGSVVPLSAFWGESPDPLESCGYRAPSGLPLIVMLPSDPPPNGILASLQLPHGEVISGADLCVVSEDSFRSSDAVYGPTGRSILDGDNAVLIIPRERLAPGRHVAAIDVPGQGRTVWSFTVSG